MDKSPARDHNYRLSSKFISESGIHSRYPKVTDQIDCVALDTSKLNPFAYNPSIIRHGGELMMSFRWHNQAGASNISVVAITDDFKTSDPISLSCTDHTGMEDPKLFEHRGKMMISWVASRFPDTARSAVRYSELFEDFKPSGQIGLPGNDFSGVQKNWVFFSRNDALWCIYQEHPSQKVYKIFSSEAFECLDSEGPAWPYGDIRGDTAPIDYGGKLLRFFHSRTDRGIGHAEHRYYIGAVLHEPEPPFSVVAVSKKPIIYGSEVDGLTADQRLACFHHKRNVVFSGGAIEHEGGWLLSVGVNDSAIVLAKINPKDLNL
jgi:predicted GH43/DUF377 family glycosyl hydrolase